eukprot:GEMP01087762.1.p1 GENE.GEMP01087762.1~~GEMP01087762.1.p1  ORF type:complete len:110 (+),score=12.63 GEMP01087762.1:52-381(+)
MQYAQDLGYIGPHSELVAALEGPAPFWTNVYYICNMSRWRISWKISTMKTMNLSGRSQMRTQHGSEEKKGDQCKGTGEKNKHGNGIGAFLILAVPIFAGIELFRRLLKD